MIRDRAMRGGVPGMRLRFYRQVLRWSLEMVTDRTEASKITEEVFERAGLLYDDGSRPRVSVGAWLYGILLSTIDDPNPAAAVYKT